MTTKFSKIAGKMILTAACATILFGVTAFLSGHSRSDAQNGFGTANSSSTHAVLVAGDGQESHGGKGGGHING